MSMNTMIDLDNIDSATRLVATQTSRIMDNDTTRTDAAAAAASDTCKLSSKPAAHIAQQQQQQSETQFAGRTSSSAETHKLPSQHIQSHTNSSMSTNDNNATTTTTQDSNTSPQLSPTTLSPSASLSQDTDSDFLTCMLITANVGTIFEESTLLDLWFQQLKAYLTKVKPQLVAIHCQEVGGKNFESSTKCVSNFTDKIVGDQSIVGDYTRVRIFLDENFDSLEKFTALGSLYLLHDSVKDVELYNFKTLRYDKVEGIEIYNGTSTTAGEAAHVQKLKFPQELFPDCRWSRKGFMRTRWLFNGQQPLDLVNIHLFHDASNLVAMTTTPSPYAQNRQRALEYTLNEIARPLAGGSQQSQSHTSSSSSSSSSKSTSGINATENSNKLHSSREEVPLFIFGDFNFRLDANKVIQRITDGIEPTVKRCADSNEVVQMVYHRKRDTNEQADISRHMIDGDSVVMTVGKKLFDCENLDETFRAAKNTEWLLELDKELDSFKSKLFEFKIAFSPSYPFKEDTSGGYSYMKTRCPAWCDRILFNSAGCRLIYGKHEESARSVAHKDEILNNNNNNNYDQAMDSEKQQIKRLQDNGEVLYRLMGNSVPMGDHKPVLLYCRLALGEQDKNIEASAETQQQQQQV